MLFYVDPQSGVPVFRQLMDQVKLHIATGGLAPGDELPSIRKLAIPLGVNPMTISKAYNLLVHDGVLERRPGLPLVVAEVPAAELAESRQEQLATALRPVVGLVRQLAMPADEAVALFADLLRGRTTDGKGD